MQRNSLLIGVGALLAGCAAPQPIVYVDLDWVARQDAPAPFESPEIPIPPKATEGKTLTMGARPSQTLQLSEGPERAQRVRDVIRAAREQTLKELTKRLQAAYRADIRRVEAARLAEIEPRRRDAVAGAYGKMRAVFDAYAERRAPDVIRLALIAGFPDPDPAGAKPPAPEDKLGTLRFQEAKQVRLRLAEAERDYRASLAELLAGPERDYADELTRLRIEIEEMRLAADHKAQQEAAQQVDLEEKDLNTALSERSSIELAGSPARSLPVPGVPAPSPAPDVRPASKQDLVARERELAAVDAKIWAAQRGYRLVSVAGARNATEEFYHWRSRLRAGR